MPMIDKKKVASLVLKRMKGSSDVDGLIESNSKMTHATLNENGDETDSTPGMTAAADEMISAISSGNSKKLVGALKSFIELCELNEEGEEMAEEY